MKTVKFIVIIVLIIYVIRRMVSKPEIQQSDNKGIKKDKLIPAKGEAKGASTGIRVLSRGVPILPVVKKKTLPIKTHVMETTRNLEVSNNIGEVLISSKNSNPVKKRKLGDSRVIKRFARNRNKPSHQATKRFQRRKHLPNIKRI